MKMTTTPSPPQLQLITAGSGSRSRNNLPDIVNSFFSDANALLIILLGGVFFTLLIVVTYYVTKTRKNKSDKMQMDEEPPDYMAIIKKRGLQDQDLPTYSEAILMEVGESKAHENSSNCYK